MKFTFLIDSAGSSFVKENKGCLHPNIDYNESESTLTLDTEDLKFKCTPGQFMSEIKRLGLIIGAKCGRMIILNSVHISRYPYKLEAL